MTLKETMEKYLKDNGYAGLFSIKRGNDCICKLDEDFMHCDGDNSVCIAGYEVPCTEFGGEDDCKSGLSEKKPTEEMADCDDCGKLFYISDICMDDGVPFCENCYESAKWIQENKERKTRSNLSGQN